MNSVIEKFLLSLPDYGAFKLGVFSLKQHEKNPSLPKSPFYLNLRVLRSYPEALKDVAQEVERIARGCFFDLIADIPTGSTPIVTAVSLKTGWSMISPRLERKSYGSGEQIDGTFVRGEVVLLIDDVITNAESKIKAIKVLEQNGLKVNDVLVVIDRQQGGKLELEQAGYHLHSLATLDELVQLLFEQGRISEDAVELISKYRQGRLVGNWSRNESETSEWTKIK